MGDDELELEPETCLYCNRPIQDGEWHSENGCDVVQEKGVAEHGELLKRVLEKAQEVVDTHCINPCCAVCSVWYLRDALEAYRK